MSRDFACEELESLNLRLSLRIIRRRGRATGTRTRPTTAWRSKATGDVPAHLVEFSLALASWCARLGRLQRLRTVKWATRPPSWRTNWRAPTDFPEDPGKKPSWRTQLASVGFRRPQETSTNSWLMAAVQRWAWQAGRRSQDQWNVHRKGRPHLPAGGIDDGHAWRLAAL